MKSTSVQLKIISEIHDIRRLRIDTGQVQQFINRFYPKSLRTTEVRFVGR